MSRFSLAALAAILLLAACGGSDPPPAALAPAPPATDAATCGPGSRPETGLQGRVSRAEHQSGRAAQGYTCNTELVGSYNTPNSTGTVGGFKVERYTDASGRDCAYFDTTLLFPTNAFDQPTESGVTVLDMSDPARPTFVAQLRTPAMQSPHESVVVSQQGGVLAAVTGNPVFYPGVVDVYDLAADCRNPVLKFSGPLGMLGHESGIAPDGKTFYSASPGSPTLTAIDISDPARPAPLWTGDIYSHGLSISNDGNRAYLGAGDDQGLMILDTSQIQARMPNPQVPVVARLTWPTMTIPQNAIPFTRNGKPYVLEVDEYSRNPGGTSVAAHGSIVGAARIIDISDETQPRVVSDIRLEVHQPEHRATIANDPGAQNPTQGYAAHYCNLPTRRDPDIVACSMIVSGLRIFDIRDPLRPREVAYFNAPVSPRSSPYFEASNWAMSSPAFVPERKEIWYTDGYSGFYAVRVTNGAWPD